MTRYDVYERFAGEHLRTREQRVVYFALVAQTRETWSVAEIAALNTLAVQDVGAVLERYEAAGIVEAEYATLSRRYRWRSDMNYLFGNEDAAPDPLDPVCGMRVGCETPYGAVDAAGRLWTFCSADCLAVFRRSRARAVQGVAHGL